MARDPDTFRVSPALTQLPMMVAPPVQDAGPEQLVQAGQAITNAGRVASSLYEDALKEQNATRVTEALTGLTERRNALSVNALSQTGKNALERASGKALDEEFGGELDSAISELEQSLGNDAQRQMFRERAQGMAVEFRGRMQAHVVEQDRTYRLETYAGMADTFSAQLANARDEAEIGEAISGITAAANNIFAIKGTPKEAQEGVVIGLLSPGHTAQLTRMIEADEIDGAEAYLNKYRDQIKPATLVKIEGALVEQRAIISGENYGEQVWGEAQGEAAAGAPQEVLMPYIGNFTPTDNFGQNRGTHRHAGRDIPMGMRTPIRAGADGTIRVKRDPDGYGLYADIKLDNGDVLRMAHLDSAEIEDGARVRQGQVIARSGNSGRSTGPHLHYEVRPGGGPPVDPVEWHQGRPKTPGRPNTGGSLSDMLQRIDEDDSRTPKEKQYAKQLIKERYAARETDESRMREGVRSRAFAEVDSTGRLSNATRASLIGAGMGDLIPQLRNFERATQERRSGKPVGEADSLEAYGRVAIGIADGQIGSFDQLMQFKPYLSDSQFKQLADQFAKSPRTARDKAAQILEEMKGDIKGNPIFLDEDGKKIDQKKYNTFVGSVITGIEGRELVTGKPMDKAERREFVLGLMAQSTVDGEKMRNFEVYRLYDNIPPRARLEAVRALRRNGIRNPSIADVVNTWNQVDPGARRIYEGTR